MGIIERKKGFYQNLKRFFHKKFDAVILAVAHLEFLNLNIQELKKRK